ncbi:unnamed protein product [Dibothriocephalus latus]|uniref:Retrotransposon gag domain-containing protein n=1 Tax=Dibothriocephalus latus TaxID=60516 RepID=A0A3P7RFD2_DIBLA|nr:unnamed protein product [Dibothriocephalus latus]
MQDASDLQTAFTKLEAMWGGKENIFLRRHRFCQMRQESSQYIGDFIINLTLVVQDCRYTEIAAPKFEEAVLLQQLMVGLRDEVLSEKDYH